MSWKSDEGKVEKDLCSPRKLLGDEVVSQDQGNATLLRWGCRHRLAVLAL